MIRHFKKNWFWTFTLPLILTFALLGLMLFWLLFPYEIGNRQADSVAVYQGNRTIVVTPNVCWKYNGDRQVTTYIETDIPHTSGTVQRIKISTFNFEIINGVAQCDTRPFQVIVPEVVPLGGEWRVITESTQQVNPIRKETFSNVTNTVEIN